jgi:hypothetical protein
MKKQRVTLLSMLLAVVLMAIVSVNLYSGDPEGSMYGHISYVDKGATVIRQDKTEQKAVVNLPVAPGDQIVTGEKGRCELQFDNGTVIRVDKDSRLKVTTVLAPSLTSNWKITTLHLMRGQLCSINQSYKQEMFQVITPNAAIDLKKRSTTYIQLKGSGDTFIFAERGKFKLMYGEDVHSLKTEEIRSDKGYLVTADHRMRINEGKRDIDFVAWNEYVNRNFKDLHYGISKVPKKILRYNKALVHWAEKWSSLYGEWVYDELFGYVWKPGDELFSYSRRPFFHANFVRVNNELFLVPQQPWGWVPAHMGTWVWLAKGGWTWVPGNAFNSGLQYDPFWKFSAQYGGYCCSPTLGYWIRSCYGGYDLYYLYRDHGVNAWRTAYQEKYSSYKKHPVSKEVPKNIRDVIGRMNKAPARLVKERLGSQLRSPVIEVQKIKPFLKSIKPSSKGNTNAPSIKVKSDKIITSSPIIRDVSTVSKESPESKFRRIRTRSGGGGSLRLPVKSFRDFNPDTHWASKKGFNVRYSSISNAVVCPNLGLSSKTITKAQRAALIGKSSVFPGSRSRTSVSSSGSGSSTGKSTTASSTVTGGGGGGSRSSGVGSGSVKDK